MPMIGGRFYMNPAVGEAIESTRGIEAEAAEPGAPADGEEFIENAHSSAARDSRGRFLPRAPIHRIEIFAAEQSPSGAKTAQGFAVRVHRLPPGELRLGPDTHAPAPALPSAHIFLDHNDLANFIREELAKDAQ